MLESRFEQLHSSIDGDKALAAFKASWSCENAIPINRVRVAAVCVRLLKQRRLFLEAAAIAKEAVQLLPAIKTRALSRQDQQTVLAEFSGLAAEACALRLEIGQASGDGSHDNTEGAVEMLEAGCGALLSLALEDRADTSRLAAVYPEHATRLDSCRAASNGSVQKADLVPNDLRWHLSPIQLLKDSDACVDEIRTLPGFESFIKAPSIDEIKAAATGGVLAVVNITDLRSDAILITPSCVRLLRLRKMKISRVEGATTSTPWGRCSGSQYNTNRSGDCFLRLAPGNQTMTQTVVL
jgi:hypothetical protein